MPFRLQIIIHNPVIKIHVKISTYALIWPIEQIPFDIRWPQSQWPGLLLNKYFHLWTKLPFLGLTIQNLEGSYQWQALKYKTYI